MARALVAYASNRGTTAQIAEVVGEVLAESGAEVDVLPVQRARDLSGYDAVILGGACQMGRLIGPARKFAKKHRDDLQRVPVAYFTVGAIMSKDTPETRAQMEKFVEPLRQVKEPVSVEFFGGRAPFTKVDAPSTPKNDWRDLNKVRGWATRLVPLMTAPVAH